MPSARQDSFAGGELDPTLWGAGNRPGIVGAKYASGLRRMFNAYPVTHGAAVNRAGTGLVSARAGADHTAPAILIPFIYSELANQAYVIELGPETARFVAAGGYVAPDPALYPVYAGGTTYELGAWVSSGGVAYKSLQAGNVGHDPAVSPAWWEASSIYEIRTPFLAADLERVQFSQRGDVVTLTRRGYPQQEIRRYAHARWSCAPISYRPPVPMNLAVGTEIDGFAAGTPKQWAITVVYADGRESLPRVSSPFSVTLSAAVFATIKWHIDDWPSGYYPTPIAVRIYRGTDRVWGLVHEASVLAESMWGASGQFEDTGAEPDFTRSPPTWNSPFHSAPVPWTVGTHYWPGDRVTANGYVYEALNHGRSAEAGAGPQHTSGVKIDGIAGRKEAHGGVFGGDKMVIWGGRYRATGIGICDTGFDLPNDPGILWGVSGADPGYTDGTAHWKAEIDAGATLFSDAVQWEAIGPASDETNMRAAYPAAVGSYEDRQVYAGADDTPERIHLSATGDYNRFDPPPLAADDAPIEFDLASRLREEIRWVLGASRLMVGTSSGVWATGGADRGPITPFSIDAKLQSEEGVDWIRPVVAGDQVLYVTARGLAVRELLFDDARQKFLASDLTILARHLFRGRRVVDWAWQRHPHSLLWVVFDDGSLATLSYLRELDVWGWAPHQLAGGGAVERIACIPEGQEDTVYLFVRRELGGLGKRYLERFTSREVLDARLGVFLDSSLTFDGRNTGAVTLMPSLPPGPPGDPAPFAAGGPVRLEASASPFFAAGDVGDRIVLDPDGAAIPLTIMGFVDADTVDAVCEKAIPAALQLAPTTSWAWARDTFSGLDHLEGETVVALADGNVVRTDPNGDPLVVTAGEVTLPEPAAIVHVGLGYVSELELLDLAGGADLRDREKIVKKVVVELEKSRGLRVGKDFASLSLWTQRQVADGYGPVPLFTGRAEVLVSGDWAKHGRAAVRQADPLPMTVTAITREVELGGK